MKPLKKQKQKSLHLNKRKRKLKKGPVMVLGFSFLALVFLVVFAIQQTQSGIEIPLELTSNKETPTNEEQPVQQAYDIDTPSSLTFVINKQRPLAADYVPSDLVIPNVTMREGISNDEQYVRKEAAEALEKMVADAAKAGIDLVLGSGYRSYALQESLFASYEAISGTEEANLYSAKAGQSEHQTGLAVDLGDANLTCYLEVCFEETDTGKWLKENAPKYGFILRFMSGKEMETGYQYEPWHFRYLGVELAQKVTDAQQTLEAYFQLNE